MADRVFARLAGSAPPAPSGPTITSYGVTWTFSTDVVWGTFITGDPWVLGPVTVTAISPPWADDGGGAFTNGAALNPQAYNTHSVGFDPLKLYGQGYTQRYKYYVDNMNVANKLPQTLVAGDTLVSSVGYLWAGKMPDHWDISGSAFTGPQGSVNNVIKENSVLTVLSEPPPSDAFRPAFSGYDKRIFTLSQVNASLLPSLAPTAGTTQFPRPPRGSPIAGATGAATYAGFFKRPWVGIIGRDYLDAGILGADNGVVYYAYIHQAMSDALFMLMSNQSKQDLMVNMIQQGIDHYGGILSCNAQGVAANQNVGGRSLSRFPALLAGTLLQDTTVQTVQHWAFPNNGNGGLREDFQTYYGGPGWTGATALWRFKPLAEHEEVDPTQWHLVAKPFNPNTGGNCGCYTESYRRENGGGGRWCGYALFIRRMGLESVWGHSAFLDYVDRWFAEGNTGTTTVNANCAGPNSISCLVHQRYVADPANAADPSLNSNCYCVNEVGTGGFYDSWAQNMWTAYR